MRHDETSTAAAAIVAVSARSGCHGDHLARARAQAQHARWMMGVIAGDGPFITGFQEFTDTDDNMCRRIDPGGPALVHVSRCPFPLPRPRPLRKR